MSKQEITPSSPGDSLAGQSQQVQDTHAAGAHQKFQEEVNLAPASSQPGDQRMVTAPGHYVDVTPIATVFNTGAPSYLPPETIRHAALMSAQTSVADLTQLGVFTQATAEPGQERALHYASITFPADKATDQVQEVERRTEPVQQIQVVYTDQANDPTQRVTRADFKVKKDGSIEVVNNPEQNNQPVIVIEVERGQGETGRPPKAQQESIDGLTSYLAVRMLQAKDNGNKDIEDKQGLVSEKVKAELKATPTTEHSMPDATRHQIENMDRFSGGGRGRLSAEQADSYFPTREVPRLPNETNQQAALKDVVAGMLQSSEAHPYEATRKIEGRGTAVGRYMLTYELFMEWLTDLMGDPPDPAKLDAAVKAGKISQAMAAKLKSPQFKAFLDKMKKGEQLSAAEIKEFMPKEFQETVAGDLITKFANQTKDAQGNVDAGKVALAMVLGHVPSQDELATGDHKSFCDAARRLYSIASARTTNPGQSLDWQEIPGAKGEPSTLAVKLAQSAERNAARTGTVGWCYAGVKDALSPFGINLTGGSAYMARDQLARDSRFVQVPFSQLQKGDILVHGASAGHKHGHIAVYLGNGREASDHIQQLITGRGYGGTTVFRARASQDTKAV